MCGRGFHVSDTPRQAIGFANGSYRPWRYFQVEYTRADVIEEDKEKKRLSRLSSACNRLLAIAAVIGRDFDLDVLERVAGIEEDALVAFIRTLTDSTFLNNPRFRP